MSIDRGVQAERTTLAWTRTGIAAGVLAGLFVRQAVRTGSGFDAVAAAVCVLGAGAILGVGSRALRPLRRLPGDERPCDYRGVQVVTCTVLLLGFLTSASLATNDVA